MGSRNIQGFALIRAVLYTFVSQLKYNYYLFRFIDLVIYWHLAELKVTNQYAWNTLQVTSNYLTKAFLW